VVAATLAPGGGGSGVNDNQLNTELLDAELPDPRFVDDAYLRWLYDENPDGAGIQAAADEDGVRVAHYALVPQTYRNAAGPAPLLFSLNAVTRSTAQRKGYWVQLGNRGFEQAIAQGRKLVIGVPNEKSTPGAVKYLGYRFLGPMPVHVVVPTSLGRGYRDHAVDEAFLASPAFDAMAADLDQHETVNWVNSYSPERLRWRLARPHGGYAVHVGPDLVGVYTKCQFRAAPRAGRPEAVPSGAHGGGGAALAAARHRGGLSLPAGAGRRVRRVQRSRPGAGCGAAPPAATRPRQTRRAPLQPRPAPGDHTPRH